MKSTQLKRDKKLFFSILEIGALSGGGATGFEMVDNSIVNRCIVLVWCLRFVSFLVISYEGSVSDEADID